MAEYDNTDRCVLFRVKNKESEKHPDWSGNANYEGVDCWASGWDNTSKAGDEYLTIKFKKKESLVERVKEDMPTDEIPF